jgi:hypothetical protein
MLTFILGNKHSMQLASEQIARTLVVNNPLSRWDGLLAE